MLPAAASFKKEGANKGALAAFLVSTPESGIDSIAITYALLDPIMTIARPLAAFVTGITAGLLENALSWRHEAYDPAKAGEAPDVKSYGDPVAAPKRLRADFRAGLNYAFGEVWGEIVFWFFGGLLLAGIITVLIPDDLSEMVLGGGFVSMLIMLVVGMPVYICASASTPIAAALLLKGASPGAVLVFLLAGPATNLTSLSVLVRILGTMGVVRYLLVIAIVSVAFGLGLDAFYRLLAIEPQAIIGDIREIMPFSIKLGATIILLVLSLVHVYKWVGNKLRKKEKYQFVSGFPEIDGYVYRDKRTGSPFQADGKARENDE